MSVERYPNTLYAKKTDEIFSQYLSASPPPLSGFGISAENQIPAKKYLAYYVANGTISLISKWLEDNCYMEAEEFARIIYSYCGALFGIKTAVGQDAAHTIIQ